MPWVVVGQNAEPTCGRQAGVSFTGAGHDIVDEEGTAENGKGEAVVRYSLAFRWLGLQTLGVESEPTKVH